jgi:hypothetical protein
VWLVVSTDDARESASGSPPGAGSGPSRVVGLWERVGQFVRAVRDGDEEMAAEAVLQLSQSRRLFAPLAFVVGGIAMLFDGLKLLFSNWRLTLVQILPAMWVWVAMLDLKAHALHGRSFEVLQGPVLIPIVLAIAAVTAASFFLNAVFAFAIVQSHSPQVRPAVAKARSHLTAILVPGTVVGLALGFSTTVVTRWGRPWFGLSLGIVVGVMMVAYVAVPSRLIGVKPQRSARDKLAASAVGGAMGAVVCTPPYLLGRLGILMLGSKVLLIPGIVFIVVGFTLHAGATGAVKAVKMGAKLIDPGSPTPPEAAVSAADSAQTTAEATARDKTGRKRSS